MSIRLSKACKDLNIGMSTAIEFLAKKGYKLSVDPNLKLEEDLHLLLAKEFNKDMALKIESERLSQERQIKDKGNSVSIEGYSNQSVQEKVPETIHVTISEDQLPHFKSVGHINLDRPKKFEIKKEIEIPVIETITTKHDTAIIEDKVEVVDEIQTEEIDKIQDQINSVEKESPSIISKITAEPIEKVEDIIPAIKESNISENINKDDVFSLNRSTIDKTPVVVGTIDLELLNQSTRPKPKTKEQKKKEREEKSKITTNDIKKISVVEKKVLRTDAENLNDSSNPKKKRERFNNQKIDINSPQKNTSGSNTQGFAHPKKQNTNNNTKGTHKEKFQKPIKTVVDEIDVQKQIKETLARLSGANKKGKGSKYRRDKRDSISARQQELAQRERDDESVLKLTEFVTVSELAVMMNVSVNQVIGTCMSIGMMVSINQRLDAETINIVAEEFGFTTEYVSAEVIDAIGEEEEDTEQDLLPRSPIVTVMGHVDHGKTSLLDYIRKTNVIAGEAGGITQHIGAYNVQMENGQHITFLDTPGHEAFTAMRARGAKVTDIAIIIVAADDSVMPQTIEAINHASAANVPMVFAINKIDKPGANPEKIKETLANMNYLVEDWGGKYQSHEISAKKGIGVKELLEKVLLEAELLELKANPNKRAVGSVIESTLDKGRGYVSTILVQNGTLKQGDVVLAGTYFGKVKAMFNERNQRITEVHPGEPALILGLNGASQAGDNFNVLTTEQEAREIANKREQLQREQSLRTKKHFTLDELGRRIALGDFKELNIIVKGDVDGSVEALADSLLKLSTENIQINVIHKAVGAISDSDILLAAASNAIICGFNVRPSSTARKMAEKEEIDIRLYSIIYDAIEEIKSAMEGMLSPEIKEEITATVEIQEVFKITKVGTVAGCLVREGKIKRNNKVRVIRDGIVIYTGELESLKRFKEDVKEVGVNYECGLNIKNYNDIRIGDMIESFEETEVKKTL
jgi:translation initiation factor IF-2